MKKIIGMLIVVLAMVTPLFAQDYNSDMKKTTPTDSFSIHNDGTVTDNETGLMWKMASEGQTWNAGTVTGSATKYAYANVEARVDSVNAGTAGENYTHDDWRLPTIKELASISELAAYSPAINLEIFPNTLDSLVFWSSSLWEGNAGFEWCVDFKYGVVNKFDKTDSCYVRLVRSAE